MTQSNTPGHEVKVLDDGSKFWLFNGELHRADGPAIEWADGSKSWWLYGKLHRDNDLPAIESADGSKSWWVVGVLYRSHSPTIEFGDV